MLHSGSRGVGNAIGTLFIELAKKGYATTFVQYSGSRLWLTSKKAASTGDYVKAVGWGQQFAKTNREIMIQHVIDAMRKIIANRLKRTEAVNCHPQLCAKRKALRWEEVYVTRKGAGIGQERRVGNHPDRWEHAATSYVV